MVAPEVVIGLETHVQLRTATKLFCGCPTAFGAPPNSQVCEICLGHPGTLPVVNRAAVEAAVRVGLALNGTIAGFTKFDRKNYFYPDLPKDYQISQYDLPISSGGFVEIGLPSGPRRIGIVRAHLEEDAGKLVHEDGGKRSFVDLNRCGVPLVEIVTRPDFRTSTEVWFYLNALKAILQYIGASECDMEKGELRVDVNVSVHEPAQPLGTKVEIKNLNSFKFAQDAVEAEWRRQWDDLQAGRPVVQETRLYDPHKRKTFVMRSKEEAHDYRYFPEPDLPPLKLDSTWVEKVRLSLPELPIARRDRLIKEYGVSEVEAVILVADRAAADFFEAAARMHAPKAVSNWVINEVFRVLNVHKLSIREAKAGPATLVDLLRRLEAQEITAASAKEILEETLLTGKPPAEIVRDRGLAIVTDTGAIERAVDEVVAANAKVVADFKGGKDAALKFLIGQVMKKTGGRVKAPAVEELLRKKLS
jgi:aspartyl-tRNA(Asn)/glutamyl-tRNA(Gln) amidotransferase subunit B